LAQVLVGSVRQNGWFQNRQPQLIVGKTVVTYLRKMLGLLKKRIPLNIDKSKFETILSKLIELLTDSSNLEQVERVELIKSALMNDDKTDF
tara:strand:+ start:1083 stop:1355 length:273 start_codon:yes stop_codon:yes gene_type:complete